MTKTKARDNREPGRRIERGEEEEEEEEKFEEKKTRREKEGIEPQGWRRERRSFS
jgi:hypothetical protein